MSTRSRRAAWTLACLATMSGCSAILGVHDVPESADGGETGADATVLDDGSAHEAGDASGRGGDATATTPDGASGGDHDAIGAAPDATRLAGDTGSGDSGTGDAEAGGPAPSSDAAPDAPSCPADPICTVLGPTCNASASSVVSCNRNGDGCLYQASSSPCSNGACTGAAGAATCCTNACAASTCPSSTEVETCSMGSNGCLAAASSTCSTGFVCERYGTASCADPSWAEWPMPNDTTADPGSPNPMSYTDNGDGTVTDMVTALLWEKSQSPSSVTWGVSTTTGTAQNYCATLTLAGHSDWRLPTIEELVSIVDPAASNPRINVTYFPGTPNALFWSSTPYAASSSDAWAVSMYDSSGSDHAAFAVTAGGYARCVR